MNASSDLVIVTGTSSGLGQAIAQRLVSSGYRVVGIARREVSADSLGVDAGSYHHLRYDLGDLDGIGAMVRSIIDEWGPIYGLVNNAAIGTDGLLPTMHNSEIERLTRVNVTSPLILTKYVVRSMLSGRRGRIINVSSIVAKTGYRGLAAYGATKAALEGMTYSLARDIGRRRITVNAVAPGFLATEMTSVLNDDNLKTIQRRSALGRFAELDEVAGTIEFLLSEDGAGITGTVLTVDAGNSA